MTATSEATRHPAKFHTDIIDELRTQLLDDVAAKDLHRHYRVLDPLAGVGGVHRLASANIETLGMELEPEWAKQAANTMVGNSVLLLAEAIADGAEWDAIITSPCYGNRMADHHNAKDDSRRNTYRHALGRELTEGSSAGLQWSPGPNDAYKEFHRALWAECVHVLTPGGMFLLNIKDHIRKGAHMKVTDWHIATLTAFGLTVESQTKVITPGNRQGANGDLRVDGEWVIRFRK